MVRLLERARRLSLSLALCSLTPFFTRARRRDDRDSRDARAPFERKFSVGATDKSQLFYLKRKRVTTLLFRPCCPVKFGGKHSGRGNFVCALFCPFSLFRSSYSFFPLTDTYIYIKLFYDDDEDDDDDFAVDEVLFSLFSFFFNQRKEKRFW